MSIKILIGDSIEQLKTLPDQSVHCCVTSPPYFGLRDYGMDGQIGLEPTPEAFIAKLVDVFREVRRVLRDDGTCWANMGDSYYNYRPGGTSQVKQSLAKHAGAVVAESSKRNLRFDSIKEKDLIGIPWMLAFALRADGWYLRQDIIWHKPNPMPESVTDRCTKSHEYIFLLSKSANYYYDNDANAEPCVYADEVRIATPKNMEGLRLKPTREYGHSNGTGTRNKRSVWTVATQPFKEAHFATFPPALIEPCILAGCPIGGTVLDPFFGAGTTGLVADRLQRSCIGIELNPAYAEMAKMRIENDAPLFAEVASESKGSGKRLRSIEETKQQSFSVPVDMSSFNEGNK